MGGILWKVYAYQGPDRPAVFILAWQNNHGEPLPLSSRLLDEVQRHSKEGRGDYKDENTLNQQRKQEQDKQWDADTGAMTEDWLFPHGRPILHRGQHLRMSRDKRRNKGEKI